MNRFVLFLWTIFAFASLPILKATAKSTTVNATQINGSFESGLSQPDGWRIHPGGSWATGAAHTGMRSLSGLTKAELLVCNSAPVMLKGGNDYRLDAWINCDSGTARLGLDLLDQNGRVLSSHPGPSVTAGSTWRYVALEVNAAKAASARVWFLVKGRAELDDVAISPIALSFMGNKGLEPDDRGRIGFWNEEKLDTLLPGSRAGAFRPDPQVKREGNVSVLVTASNNWFAISSINYGLAPWTERYELSAWALCETPASAQVLACWTDDDQKVVRIDAGTPLIITSAWQRLSLSLTAPTNVSGVRLVLAARDGKVWFDDANLLRLRPQQPRMRVFVNQVGYEQAGPKTAIVASNFFPPDKSYLAFKLRTQDGKIVFTQEVPCSGRIYGGKDDDWGWYFWRADFSSFQETGHLRAIAEFAKSRAESAPFQIGRGVVLQETAQSAVDFFFIQRCGFEVPGWHKACHLDDANLPDGKHLDAIGGWHSAGDYNKIMYEHGDGGVVFALLRALNAAPECFDRYDRSKTGFPDVLNEAIWGADFVAKMQVHETGGLRNTISQGPGRAWTKWSIPESHTDNVAGTEDDPVIQPGEGNSPLVIGAWARLSALLSKSRARLSQPAAESPDQQVKEKSAKIGEGGQPRPASRTNDYLPAALRLWKHATGDGTNVGNPYLLLSALDLHAVTSQPAYLDYARRSVESLLSQQTTTGRLHGAFGNYGEASAAALASFGLAYKDDPLTLRITDALQAYISFCVRQSDNTFGFSQQPAGGTNFFFSPDLGNNFVFLQRTWAAALTYRLTRDPAALVFATDQLDWVLGKNPLDLCLFEGKGAFNPPRYHHRYNQIPGHERGAVPGTIPNGFVRELGMADRAGMDMSRGGNRAPSFRTSEPWLVHNLFFLLAASELHQATRETQP